MGASGRILRINRGRHTFDQILFRRFSRIVESPGKHDTDDRDLSQSRGAHPLKRRIDPLLVVPCTFLVQSHSNCFIMERCIDKRIKASGRSSCIFSFTGGCHTIKMTLMISFQCGDDPYSRIFFTEKVLEEHQAVAGTHLKGSTGIVPYRVPASPLPREFNRFSIHSGLTSKAVDIGGIDVNQAVSDIRVQRSERSILHFASIFTEEVKASQPVVHLLIGQGFYQANSGFSSTGPLRFVPFQVHGILIYPVRQAGDRRTSFNITI